MFVRPKTLSLITTHQCTAACDHCCFACTPRVTKAIPVERMFGLISEAKAIPSMRVVVFTGGECFLLGKNLDRLVAHATDLGFSTRCVTNGYWAVSPRAARKRMEALRDAGLKEINFSTGTFHAKYVPPQRIIDGALAAAEVGLRPLINCEITEGDDFDINFFLANEELFAHLKNRTARFQRNVWIPNAEGHGQARIVHGSERSRFDPERMNGCITVLNVLAVTPDQNLVACCGLHLESIPDLHLGNVAHRSLKDVVDGAPDDFLKIWIHVDGPEKVLSFVKKYLPDYELPVESVHPCTTCLHLYRDQAALTTVREHYKEVESDVVGRWLSGMAYDVFSSEVRFSGLAEELPTVVTAGHD